MQITITGDHVRRSQEILGDRGPTCTACPAAIAIAEALEAANPGNWDVWVTQLSVSGIEHDMGLMLSADTPEALAEWIDRYDGMTYQARESLGPALPDFAFELPDPRLMTNF